MPTRSILCPVDFSAVSHQACEHAVALASHSGARLTVVHAVDPLLAQAAAAGLHDDLLRDTYAELGTFLGDQGVTLTPSTPPPALVVTVGEPWRVILDTAVKHGADLIVMGTQGLGGIRQLVFGSTTERVLRASQLPVLAVPPAARPEGPTGAFTGGLKLVVAAVDFSANSQDIAETAARMADDFAARLLLVHAIPTPASLHTWRAESAAADQLARGTADAALTGLAERLHTTRPTETAIVTGPPAEAITELLEVRDAGLLVLGTASALSSHRPGSTAYRTLCLSDVPVLAVPPPAVPVADRGSIPADHYEVW